MSNTTTNNKNKPMCVLCSVPLYKSESEDYMWICTNQRAHKYQIYAEVMAYDNRFATIYDEEEENQIELAGLEGKGNPILLSADNDDYNEFSKEDNTSNKSDIKIPQYMRDSDITKVVEYKEE